MVNAGRQCRCEVRSLETNQMHAKVVDAGCPNIAGERVVDNFSKDANRSEWWEREIVIVGNGVAVGTR